MVFGVSYRIIILKL